MIVFNPLDKRNLGRSVAHELVSKTCVQLDELQRFEGAGIYALYYNGAMSAYSRLVQFNSLDKFGWPIYVGKAIAEGSRKGKKKDGVSIALYSRINQHKKSIESVENLKTKDFCVKFLVVDDIWISLAERLLISIYAPVWNQLIDGFGNHDPGSRRYAGMIPRWDVLHPGRSWSSKLRQRDETAELISSEIVEFLKLCSFKAPDL